MVYPELVTEHCAGNVGPVRVYVTLPLVRLLRDVAVILAAAAEGLRELRRDALLREILPPRGEETGVEDCHVHTGAIKRDRTGKGLPVGDIDGVLIPGAESADKTAGGDTVDRLGVAFSVGAGGCHKRQRLNCRQLIGSGLDPNGIQLGDFIHQGAELCQLGAIRGGRWGLEDDVYSDTAPDRGELGRSRVPGDRLLLVATSPDSQDRSEAEDDTARH